MIAVALPSVCFISRELFSLTLQIKTQLKMELELYYTKVFDALQRIKDDRKFLSKIVSNILNEPKNKKYHDINWVKLSHRLNDESCFIELLLISGFSRSHNSERLLFDEKQLHKLQLLNDAMSKGDKITSINQLMSAGISEHEAMSIVEQSLKEAEKDDKYDRLRCMGFDKHASMTALKMTGFDINIAVQYLLNDNIQVAQPRSTIVKRKINNTQKRLVKTCNKKVTECNELIDLFIAMMEYQTSTNKKNVAQFFSKYLKKDIVGILDCFHHFLSFHNTNNEFQKVYKMFGGDVICNPVKCEQIKRRYTNRNSTTKDKKALYLEDIFTTFHCYIFHSYDIAARLTDYEQKQIDIDDNKITKLQSILNQKQLKIKQDADKRKNKFNSDLCQTQLITNGNICKYSYSFPFLYKHRFKDLNKIFFSWRVSQLYVPKHYGSLKDELISNEICTISIDQWDNSSEQAQYLQNTKNAKTLRANTDYYKNYTNSHNHPINFGYKDGSCITFKHLLCVYIYCNFDVLQCKFSETFRKMHEHETLPNVIKRHANYYHFARFLKETIEVFGIQYKFGGIKRMYHGINRKMVFDSTSAFIYAPLSTSYEWTVAVNFCNNSGLIVEFVPDCNLKYFCCNWISQYPSEAELLFIGGHDKMHIVNITDSVGKYYTEYCKSLRIIDDMTHGLFSWNDPTDFHRLNEIDTSSVALPKLSSLSQRTKKLCVVLIHEQLRKNGYQIESIYSNLNEYPLQLLHRMSLTKQTIKINWKAMNIDVLRDVDLKWSGGGYIGYSFLRSLFCSKGYQGIILNVLHSLFPNLLNLEIYQLSSIDADFMNDIYDFLKSNVSKLQLVVLQSTKKVNYSNVSIQWEMIGFKFLKIGYEMKSSENPNRFHLTQVAIRKKQLPL
eukprot:316877_1